MKSNGFFLCGGGAIGAWQSGVLTALVEKNIVADVIAGFSIGALNAAFYCLNAVDKIEKVWSKIDNKKIFKFSPGYSRKVDLFYDKKDSLFSGLLLEVESFLYGFNIFSNKPIYRILYKYIPDIVSFKTGLKFYCISYCIENSSPYIVEFDSNNYDRKRFIKMLIASSTIPLIFPQVVEEIDGRMCHLVDGGVIGKKYIDFSFFEGLKRIFIISNVSDNENIFNGYSFSDIFERKIRRILILHNKKIYYELLKLKSKPEIYFIKPPQAIKRRILDFNPQTSLQLYNEGKKYAAMFLNKLWN